MNFLRSSLILGLALALTACGGDSGSSNNSDSDQAGEQTDTGSDSSDTSDTPPKKDAGGSSTVKDAGGSSTVKDAGKPAGDAGTSGDGSVSHPTDASVSGGLDAAAKDAGGITLPTLPPLFPPTTDAGTTTTTPPTTGTGNGTRDVNGPCKDLNLVCFDIFDMWIINPMDCKTCNSGKGCQGCALPFAF